MKKFVIVKPGCREVANHLWNYMSIYAYGLEAGAKTVNPSFLGWHQYFNLGWKWVPSSLGRMWRVVDTLYGSYVVRAHKSCTLLAVNEIVLLPPIGLKSECDTSYFIGWFFRNPARFERYRNELISAFLPKKHILKSIADSLAPLNGKTLIGVHVRQQPYKGFPHGDFLVSLTRVRQIVDEYLQEKKLAAHDVALVIVSDTTVDSGAFEGFTTHTSRADDVTNLFLLSKCSVMIGTNSTSGNLSAWFGNIPHIVTTNEPIDWNYYRNNLTYFENKYATFAQ